jgi:hypothetical protein
MRLEAGLLLYITPFYFSNGTSKNKYFIVLKKTSNGVLLISLPTSQDHIPIGIEKKHGCINNSEMLVSCYYFHPQNAITDNGFSFPLETYLYAEQVNEIGEDSFMKNYQFENIDFSVLGKINPEEFTAIINCLTNSPTIKNRYKRELLKQ